MKLRWLERAACALIAGTTGCETAATLDLLCPAGTTNTTTGCVPTGTITDGGAGTDASVMDAGASEGVATVSPTSLDFARVPVGTGARRAIAFQNPGPLPASVSVVGFEGDSTGFSVLGWALGEVVVLAPNSDTGFVVELRPPASGAYRTILLVRLCASGCEARIQLTGETVSTPGGCLLLSAPDVAVGSCSVGFARCTNGAEPFLLEQVSSDDPRTFEPLGPAPGFVVPPNQSFDVAANFCPSRAGDFRTTLRVTGRRGPTPATYVIEARGVGTDEGQCTLIVQPGPLDFGRIVAGSSTERTLDVLNVGPDACSFSAEGFSRGSSSDFSLVTPPLGARITVASMGSARLRLRYSPQAEGADQATLFIRTEDLAMPDVIVEMRGEARAAGGRYSVQLVPRPFAPVSGGQIVPGMLVDDGFARWPMTFPFQLFGVPVMEVVLSTNGFIAFSDVGATWSASSPIPAIDPPNGIIAWWWDDLHANLGSPADAVTALVTGAAPNRRLVFRFRDVIARRASQPRLNAQVVLHETTNVIEVQYGVLTPGTMTFTGATVGWESLDGLEGENALGCTSCGWGNWPAHTAIIYTPIP